ncbi:hypothetical protein [Rhizobium sp. IMFF44]|uniref:hypothetical protein n=1 Tax=unclassified Rhizobium TaxID=2613769 RepID=UPI0035BB5AD0
MSPLPGIEHSYSGSRDVCNGGHICATLGFSVQRASWMSRLAIGITDQQHKSLKALAAVVWH